MMVNTKNESFGPIPLKTKTGVTDGRIVLEVLESQILRSNPLGDPYRRIVPVYLPPSYQNNQGRRKYPVVTMLTGFTGTGVTHLNYGFTSTSLPERIDRLIKKKMIPEMIVIMPDCMSRYGGSQYINSAATGRYEDHLLEEVIPYIDWKYPTWKDRKHRAVLGKSSGGYGALVLAMRHPEVFSAVACHSGDMFFELCYTSEFPIACRILEKYGGSVKRFFKMFEEAPKKSSENFPLLDCIAMSAAYSPNPKKAFPENFDFPMDLHSCERRAEVWKKWLSHDPVHMIDDKKYQNALHKMSMIFIDCGTKDEYHLQFGARILSEKLKHYKIPHRHEEFDDTHMDISYRYDVSLPIIGMAIS